ncbi:MAG: hypothetical protein JSW39_19950 [Desulfobacterales bacterium]|nr:MAG: hypothetical protein JSW39_19950 [Desulfobacterales bacterium]
MPLSPRERLLRLLQGEPIDRIPWFPRIDLWYNYHQRQETLPPDYRLSMDEIIAKIGGGIYRRGVSIYHEKLQNLEIEIQYSDPAWRRRIEAAEDPLGGNYILALIVQSLLSAKNDVFIKFKSIVGLTRNEVRVNVKTPQGEVAAKFVTSEILQEAGIRPVQSEYFIKDISRDSSAVQYFIQNIKLVPDFQNFKQVSNQVGEKGVVWARTSPYYSPLHQLMYIYMGLERTFLDLYDHRSKVEELLECIAHQLHQVQAICLDSPADFISHGGNFDATVIGPQHFAAYFVPYFAEFAQKLHSRGKFLVVHVDGEMKTLMPLFPQTQADIAEGFTPSPMTSVPLPEALDLWRGQVVIWGGIPASILSSNTPAENFTTTSSTFCRPAKRIISS